MVEQVKSVDYVQRNADYLGKVAPEFLSAVGGILNACMENENP